MRLQLILSILFSGFVFSGIVAQADSPKGFSKATITLNNTSKTGWIKEDFRGKGTIQFIESGTKKKISLSGMDIQGLEIDSIKYVSIKGDIFQVLSGGEVALLQKVTQVAGKAYYNGLETVLLDGTEGKRGNYFLYLDKQKKLKLVTDKNSAQVIAEIFSGNDLAIEKANRANGGWEQLKEAVQIYNSQRH